jgi:radical SAM protein with 4Fe4S-binding SPASM domain
MIPALVQLEMTERCDYRCQHCYRLDSEDCPGDHKELSDDDMRDIADRLIAAKLFFVTFTGGEPLVRKQLAIELSRKLNAAGIRVSLNTNLALLDASTLAQLKLRGMLISCPSANPERYREITRTGRYDVFERNLRLVIGSGVHHIVNMVVTKLNVGDVRFTAQRMAELGVTKFAATPASINATSPRPDLLLHPDEFRQVLEDLIWAHEELGLEVDVMEALPKCLIPARAFELNLPFIGRSCFAGRRNGTISPLGDVRPCGHNPNTFGNVLQEPIGAIWDRVQGWRTQLGNIHQSCIACDIQSSCSQGCQFMGVSPGSPSAIVQSYLGLPTHATARAEKTALSPGTLVRPYRNILSRREGEAWLICSDSARHLMAVNDELYAFVRETRSLPTLSLADLAGRYGVDLSDPDFQEIMRTLIEKRFFLLVNDAPIRTEECSDEQIAPSPV